MKPSPCDGWLPQMESEPAALETTRRSPTDCFRIFMYCDSGVAEKPWFLLTVDTGTLVLSPLDRTSFWEGLAARTLALTLATIASVRLLPV